MYGSGYYSPTGADAGAIARAITVSHGIKAVATENEWAYDPKRKILKYARFKPWGPLSYEYWYALLMHEIAHALYTDPNFRAMFPDDKKRREWHELHNFLEDNYIERRLELSYPRGYRYKKLLRQWGADLVMQNWYQVKLSLVSKQIPLYKQYMTLAMVHEVGLPGDEELLIPLIDEKVMSVWEDTKDFISREDFADTEEVVDYMLEKFPRYQELLEDQPPYDDDEDADRSSIGGRAISRALQVSNSDSREERMEGIEEEAYASGRWDGEEPEETFSREKPDFGEDGQVSRSILKGEWDPRVEQRNPNLDYYQAAEREVRLRARELRKKIEPHLREIRARRSLNRQKSGSPDPRRLYQAAIPRQRVFQRNAEDVRTDHYAITIAIDESGSMFYGGDENGLRPFDIAQRSAIMLIEACAQMKIPTRVTRFDHAHWVVTKGWQVEHDNKGKAMIGSSGSGGDNQDIPALTKFVKTAQQDAAVTGRKHLVFMIGDGLGEREMNDVAKQLQQKTGVEIYGIVINNHRQGNREQYPHAEFVERVEDLPDVMSRLLKKYIGKRVI